MAAIGAIPRRANRRTAHDTEKRLHIAAAHARIMHVLYMGAQRHWILDAEIQPSALAICIPAQTAREPQQ